MAVRPVEAYTKKHVLKKSVVNKVAAGIAALPIKRKEINENFDEYITLYFGREGWGKTTACASYHGAIFMATEPGTKGLSVFEYNHENGGITDYPVFVKGVDLLTTTKHNFKTVVIDTIDRLYDLCMQHVCDRLGIEHVSEDASGKRDRSGKGWTEVKKEFTYQIYRLVQSGLGIVMTSQQDRHSRSHYRPVL
jgi:hypothetical protein